MTPVVAFFNSKGGVGTTTLAYDVAWMLRRIGLNVVAVDLDPRLDLGFRRRRSRRVPVGRQPAEDKSG